MKSKISSNGWTLQGQCFQWCFDNKSLDKNERSVYNTILRHSFGFKKRWCYLGYDDFELSKATVSKTIKSLKEKNILSYKHTFKDNGHRSLNEYRLNEPTKHIKDFSFIKNDDTKKKEKDIDMSDWGINE